MTSSLLDRTLRRCSCPVCGYTLQPVKSGRHSCPRCRGAFEVWVTAAAVRDLAPEKPAEAPSAATADAPSCVTHPQNASVIACSRCGDYICEVCRIRIEGKDLCAKCFERGVERAELNSVKVQFRLPDYALAVGAASLPAGCAVSYLAMFVGLFAVFLGIQALLKIGKQPALGGRGKAVAGIVLGAAGFLLWAVLLAIIVFSIVRSRP